MSKKKPHQPSGKNDNCLQDMCCPECGNEDELLIAATMFVSVTDDGTDPNGGSNKDFDQEWDDDSACKCPECGFLGVVGQFKGQEAKAQDEFLEEFHYADGDVGVHPASGLGKELLRHFSQGTGQLPSHILIRPDTEQGQKLSNALYAAARSLSGADEDDLAGNVNKNSFSGPQG